MAEGESSGKTYDLSGLDLGLGFEDPQQDHGEGDPASQGLNLDPREERKRRAFLQARGTYEALIQDSAWFLKYGLDTTTSSIQNDQQLQFEVRPWDALQVAMKQDKRNTFHIQWSIDYLYNKRQYQACASLCFSFLKAVELDLNFNLICGPNDPSPLPDPELPQGSEGGGGATTGLERRSKKDAKGQPGSSPAHVREVLDTAMRCIIHLVRSLKWGSGSEELGSSQKVAWRYPSPGFLEAISMGTGERDEKGDECKLNLAKASFALVDFVAKEVRSSGGYEKLIDDKGEISTSQVKVMNWTGTPGLALTLGDLCLELGLYRASIEVYSLYLGTRLPHWKTTLNLSKSLLLYSETLPPSSPTRSKDIQVLTTLCRSFLSCSLKTSPKEKRSEAILLPLLSSHRIPSDLLESTEENLGSLRSDLEKSFSIRIQLQQTSSETPLTQPDLLLHHLIRSDSNLLSPEATIAMVKVALEKKGGLQELHRNLPLYVASEVREVVLQPGMERDEEEAEAEGAPRSVRTL